MPPDAIAPAADTTTDVSTNAVSATQTTAESQSTPKPKDEGAAMRYQISRERDMRIKAEKERNELETRMKTPEPKFDEITDPDGSKEIEHRIQKGIDDRMKSYVKELGLDDTLEKIKFEREQDAFFKGIEEVTPKFTALGIEAPSREELQRTLETIDTKGITREQLILLSRAENVLGLLKPKGYAPGEGGKPQSNGTPKTQEEINAEIFKAHKVFGY